MLSSPLSSFQKGVVGAMHTFLNTSALVALLDDEAALRTLDVLSTGSESTSASSTDNYDVEMLSQPVGSMSRVCKAASSSSIATSAPVSTIGPVHHPVAVTFCMKLGIAFGVL